jgi:uncharacterized LabA/DUF88 family protein
VSQRVAILLDGGFVKKKLSERLHRFPTVADVVALTAALMKQPRLQDKDLFRVYYYDAPPFEGTARNPIGGGVLNFSTTPQAARNRALIDSLELQPDFAVRRGAIVQTGWKLGRAALRSLARSQRPIAAGDLVPDMAQKGVDIRIGLDIAWIALKRVADILVLVTGDSDFVPVMKFARKEGLKVYLETLSHGVRRELKAHADLVF